VCWGDAFESIKSVKEDTYDHIFVDLNDDQFCIDLAAKNMDSLVRILKPKGVITAQVGSQDKKPKQVENWMNVFNQSFGNTKLSRISIDDKKAKELEKDLNSIFELIEALNKVDTKKVDPLTSIAETSLKLRGDEVKTKNIREQILKNSPDENKDFFVVPKVVE